MLRIVIQSEDSVEKRTMVLVELDSVDGALRVTENLEGQDIYSDCCTLHIEPSRLSSLAGSIATNDERTFDHTLDTDSTESAPAACFPSTDAGAFAASYQTRPDASFGAARAMYPRRYSPYDMSASRFPPPGAPPYGRAAAGAADADGSGSAAYGLRGPILMQMRMSEAGAAGAGGAPCANTCVMIKSLRAAAADGAKQRTVTCDHVFNIVCLYGDVVRIKVLISSGGTAMVQMADSYGTLPSFALTLPLSV